MLLLALLSTLLATCARRGDAPIVVLVLVDTLRADALGCYGSPRPTPAIDALAADGWRFEHAISSSGWTLPAAASILTGVSPPVHQARGKGTRLTPISPDVATGAEVLSAAGVRTLAFTNAAFVNPLLGLTRGFEHVSHHHAYNHKIRRADETVDEALAQLADDDGRPTLVLLHLFDAHLDYDPPGEFARLYTEGLADPRRPLAWQDCSRVLPGRPERVTPEHVVRVRAAYDAEVAFVDAQIGRLVGELEARGDLGRTTLVVTSDHGEEFWEHGAFEHGHSLYDELVRVPLVVSGPGARGGLVVEPMVRTLDLMPTVFEWFGVTPPDGFEGESLSRAAHTVEDRARWAFSDGTLYGFDKTALRNERYKLIVDRNPDAARPAELYDWVADPGETRDLVRERPEVAAALAAELDRRLAAFAARARDLRPGELKDLSPASMQETLRQLESLGYGGDD